MIEKLKRGWRALTTLASRLRWGRKRYDVKGSYVRSIFVVSPNASRARAFLELRQLDGRHLAEAVQFRGLNFRDAIIYVEADWRRHRKPHEIDDISAAILSAEARGAIVINV